MSKRPYACCPKFEETVLDDNLLTIYVEKSHPQTVKQMEKVAVCMQSDGGHGGLEEITFCPFCGTKVEFTEVGT